MAKPATIRPVGTLGAILLFGTATSAFASGASAQNAPTVIDQVQLTDVFNPQSLTVDTAAAPAQVSAPAAGASIGVAAPAPLSLQSNQETQGVVYGVAGATIANAAGQTVQVSAAALGDVVTAASCCGASTGAAVQLLDGYQAVVAESSLTAGGTAAATSVQSVAVGNAQSLNSSGASLTSNLTQNQFGTTDAELAAAVGGVNTSSLYAAVSAANASSAVTDTGATTLVVNQTASGYVTQANLVASQTAGAGASAAAVAAGNTADLTAEAGSATFTTTQTVVNPVIASAALSLGPGASGAALANGVGNSTSFSTGGASTTATAQQNNNSPLTITASLTGGAGAEGGAAAFGVGDSVFGVACPSCSGSLKAGVGQTNAGAVSATAATAGGGMGLGAGQSSATGNSAAFIVQKSGG